VLESLIGTCLEKDPEERWQTARDIKRALALPSVPVAPSRRTWRPVTAALTVAILAAGGWAAEHFRTASPPLRVIRSQRLETGNSFWEPTPLRAASLFTERRDRGDVDGKTSLWLSPLDGSPARQVEGAENPAYPFWSPDNKSVRFFAGGGILPANRTSQPLPLSETSVQILESPPMKASKPNRGCAEFRSTQRSCRLSAFSGRAAANLFKVIDSAGDGIEIG
jgi:hypothetical protein